MTGWVIPLLVGCGTGILSSWGVGGGTLLLLIMTLVLGVPAADAMAVNLLYFLPTAGMGLLQHKKNGLGAKSELKPPAYARATATRDPSRVCDLHHSSRQRRIINPLSKARDQTRNLMVPSRIC